MGQKGKEEIIPDTLQFIDWDYQGDRFEGKNVVVFGGSSGIGFASAAYFMQECARVAIVARNHLQIELARQQLEKIDRKHCGGHLPVATAIADVTKRKQVRLAFDKIGTAFEGKINLVLNSAGHAGFIGVGLAEVPEEIFFSKFDAVLNNLYGAMFVSAEATKFWNLTSDGSSSSSMSEDSKVLISLSSEEGLTPCPSCEMYGISKSGIIQLSRSLAEMYEGELRSYVIAPGLVNTPLTWNQIRGSHIGHDGALIQDDHLQMYQCYNKSNRSSIIKDGTCTWGGTGFGCPCPDEKVTDDRLPLKYGKHLWPPIDPRQLASLALFLGSDDGSRYSGQTFVVDNNYTRINSTHHVVRACPSSMTQLCPVINLSPSTLAQSNWLPMGRVESFDVTSFLLGMLCTILIHSLLNFTKKTSQPVLATTVRKL